MNFILLYLIIGFGVLLWKHYDKLKRNPDDATDLNKKLLMNAVKIIMCAVIMGVISSVSYYIGTLAIIFMTLLFFNRIII